MVDSGRLGFDRNEGGAVVAIKSSVACPSQPDIVLLPGRGQPRGAHAEDSPSRLAGKIGPNHFPSPHGGGNYSQYFPAAFSSLLLNVPSGNLSMSNIALNAGV